MGVYGMSEARLTPPALGLWPAWYPAKPPRARCSPLTLPPAAVAARRSPLHPSAQCMHAGRRARRPHKPHLLAILSCSLMHAH